MTERRAERTIGTLPESAGASEGGLWFSESHGAPLALAKLEAHVPQME